VGRWAVFLQLLLAAGCEVVPDLILGIHRRSRRGQLIIVKNVMKLGGHEIGFANNGGIGCWMSIESDVVKLHSVCVL